MGRVTQVPLARRPLEVDPRGRARGLVGRAFFLSSLQFSRAISPELFSPRDFRSWETYTQRVLIFCLPDGIDFVIIHGCGEVLRVGSKEKAKKGKHYDTLKMVFNDELSFHYCIFALSCDIA